MIGWQSVVAFAVIVVAVAAALFLALFAITRRVDDYLERRLRERERVPRAIARRGRHR